ncbi:hypothetical protein NDU88_001766, partial [Pleurodeles waltl]
ALRRGSSWCSTHGILQVVQTNVAANDSSPSTNSIATHQKRAEPAPCGRHPTALWTHAIPVFSGRLYA